MPVFQILLVIGIGNAVVNFIAEPLTGMGFMPFRAKLILAQGVATFVALAVLVPTYASSAPRNSTAGVFSLRGCGFHRLGRRANTSAAALWRQLRPAVKAVALQIAVSASCRSVSSARECRRRLPPVSPVSPACWPVCR